jgi:O-antigen/teichoic acid export membrane protein
MGMGDEIQSTYSTDHSAGRRALCGSAWQLAVQMSIVPVGISILLYLTRRLGPAIYGEYATVMAVVVWIEFALGSLLNRATIKLVADAAEPPEMAAAMVRLATVLGILGTALLWLLAGPIARVLGDTSLAPLFALASVDIALFVTGSAYVAAIAGLGRFGRRAIATSLRWPLRLILSVLFIEAGLGVPGALWAVIGASIGELLVCALCCPLSLWRKLRVPKHLFLAEAMPLFGAALSLRALDGGDLLMLRIFGASAEESGAYAAAMNLAMLPGMCAAAVGPVLLATMAQLRLARQDAQIGRLGSLVLQIGAWLLPTALAICVASPAIVSYGFGSAFEPAATLFQVLLWAGLARMAISIAGVMLAGGGRSSCAWWVSAPLVPLAMFGYVTLIPLAGTIGAAWATTAASLAGAALSVRALRRQLDARCSRRTIAAVGLCSAVIAAPAGFLPLDGLRAFVYVVGAAAVSLAALWLDSTRSTLAAVSMPSIASDAKS